MKTNRVQFQPGLSMAEFMDRYGRDEQCEAALIESRWPSGFACPACGCGQYSSFRRAGLLYFQCTACRHQCSVISGSDTRRAPLKTVVYSARVRTRAERGNRLRGSVLLTIGVASAARGGNAIKR